MTASNITHLFSRIVGGDKDAFNTLFRAQYANLSRFARNYVAETGRAEELVSDVFVWLWLNRQTLAAVKNAETYLFIAVKNRCLNALRDDGGKTVSVDEYPEKEVAAAGENPLSEMEQKELSAKLRAVIASLPEQQRLVFNMIKENELTAK